MKETIRQVLQKLNNDFKDDKQAIFANPKRFRAALNDVQIETDEKRIRHLLNVAVRDMQAYTRLEAELGKNSFIIDNLANEMSSDYFVDIGLARMVVECFAEFFGYVALPEKPADSVCAEPATKSVSAETTAKSVAMRQDELQADFEMGVAHYYGYGVGKDLIKAEQCLLKAASHGHVEALCTLGDLFADGYNPNADPVQAMQWYGKAADAGHPKAQWLLGAGYLNGVGIGKDEEKARYWFEQSAAQGCADGQYGLAGYYFMAQNYREAEHWLKKAVELGHGEAKEMLEAASPLFSLL